MSINANSNKTQDLNDLQANEQAFLGDSAEDDDIDLTDADKQINEDKTQNATGDQGTKADDTGTTDNTGTTDDTGDTDMKTDENTKQQPPNQSVPPKQTGINNDHPAANPNVPEGVIEDDLYEDPLKTPETPQFSFKPDVLFHSKFESWQPITNNDFSQTIRTPCVDVESYDPNNDVHNRILTQSRCFNVIQWFTSEKAVILPPMYINIRYKDTTQGAIVLMKELRFHKVQNAYSLYLFIIFIRHFNPALFDTLRNNEEVLKVVQFAFRPKMVFLDDFDQFESSTRGDALAVRYIDHTYEAAYQLIRSTLNAQYAIMCDLLFDKCIPNLTVINTMQYFIDYHDRVITNAYLCCTAYVMRLISINKRGAFLLTVTQDKDIWEPDEFITIDLNTVEDMYLNDYGESAKLGNTSKKRPSTENVFLQKNKKPRKTPPREQKSRIYSHKTQNADTNTDSIMNEEKQNTKIQPMVNTSLYEMRMTKQMTYFMRSHIDNILRQYKFDYAAKTANEAINLVIKIKEFHEDLEINYPKQYNPALIVTQVESGMTEAVRKRWRRYIKLFKINNPNIDPKDIKTVDRLREWIVADKDLRNACKSTYTKCIKFKRTSWKPTQIADEFLLLLQKHLYVLQFANAASREEFTITLADQIKIVFESLELEAQKFLKQLKQQDNYADIRVEEARREREGLPKLTDDEIRIMQSRMSWPSWEQFRKHGSMYENDCLNRNENKLYPKQVSGNTGNAMNVAKKRTKNKNTPVKPKPKRKTPRAPRALPAVQANAITQPPKAKTTAPRRQRKRDRIYDILGPEALQSNGKYLKPDVLAKWIRSQKDWSCAYRPWRCRRKVKGGICNGKGHTAIFHDAIKQIKGCEKYLENRYNNDRNKPLQRVFNTSRWNRNRDRKSTRKESKDGNGNNQINVISTDINIQPNGTDINGNYPSNNSHVTPPSVTPTVGFVHGIKKA